MSYRLGRKPAVRPIGLRDLIAYTATDSFPPPPTTFGDVATLQAIDWGMDGNDQLGDCTIAGVDHLLAAWNALFGQTDGRPTLTSLEAEYNVLSPGDQGCVESTVLQTWQTDGLWGNKIEAYGPLNHRSQTELEQGIAFLGGVYLGIACPDSAQQQFGEQEQTGQLVPWTVVPGAQIEGGHCIVAVGFGPEGYYCVSWGALVLVTWGFLRAYCEEGWGIISEELVQKGIDTLGLDLAALKADLPVA